MTNKILAQIDDRVITENEIESSLKQLPQEQAMYFNTPEGRAQLLEQLVNFEVFLKYAKENNYDLVILDTAGRLQNKVNLMNELNKIKRVINKISVVSIIDYVYM